MTSDMAKPSNDDLYKKMMEMNKMLLDQQTQIAQFNDQLKKQQERYEEKLRKEQEKHAKVIEHMQNELRKMSKQNELGKTSLQSESEKTSQNSSCKLPVAGGAVIGGSAGALVALACSCPPVTLVGAVAIGVVIGAGGGYGCYCVCAK